MSMEQYVKMTLSTNKQVDGFFMLGVACKFATHLALIHLDGIWTTCGDGAFREGDLMLAQTTDGFCEVLKILWPVHLFWMVVLICFILKIKLTVYMSNGSNAFVQTVVLLGHISFGLF